MKKAISNIKAKIDYAFQHDLIVLTFISIVAMAYLGYINFNSAFFTLDEFHVAITSTSNFLKNIFDSGRTSHIIAFFTVELFGFKKVDFFSLLPRFFSLVLIFFTLSFIFIKLNVERKHSFFYSFFIICTHQLDWQHNGLIAYFGLFNFYFSLFFLALIADSSYKKGKLLWLFSFLAMFFSFSTELFVGGAFIYIIIMGILRTPAKNLITSPISLALFFYIILFFIGQKLASPEASAGVKD